MLNELRKAGRPLLIFGTGIRGCVEEARKFRSALGIPLLVTWGARDLFPDAPSFGTHGERAGNFAAQTADCILAIGTRLDTKATGSPASSFAPLAKLMMVDIDQAEIDKMEKIGRLLHRSLCSEAGDFIRAMMLPPVARADRHAWKAKIGDWRRRFPIVDRSYRSEETINPYVLIEQLSELMATDDVLVSDTGCSVAWIMQAFKFRGQQFIHAFNNTPMGYGVGAAIGASFATGRRVVLVTGDGGLGECVTELATVARHKLNIKIILLNNNGHAMCRSTQRQWLGGTYPATSYEGGLATPDFDLISHAYGIESARMLGAGNTDAVPRMLRWMLSEDRPALLECMIPFDAGVAPMVRFGKPLEDADPQLPDVRAILREAL